MFKKKNKTDFSRERPWALPPSSLECLGAVVRPCEVDGKPAVFHRWVDEDQALLKVNAFTSPEEQASLAHRFRDSCVVPSMCSTEVLRRTFALVEYPDGSVGKVKPELVTFLDKEG